MNLLILFHLVFFFTILQRIYELILSKKNIQTQQQSNGFIVKETNYIFMVLFHVSWFVFLAWSSFGGDIKLKVSNFSIGMILFFLGQCLRVWAIKTLGERWSTQILITPNLKAINQGPFKWFRHPNYLGVILEIFALPFALGLLNEAILLSVVNVVIILIRIKNEERFLRDYSQYDEVFSK